MIDEQYKSMLKYKETFESTIKVLEIMGEKKNKKRQ